MTIFEIIKREQKEMMLQRINSLVSIKEHMVTENEYNSLLVSPKNHYLTTPISYKKIVRYGNEVDAAAAMLAQYFMQRRKASKRVKQQRELRRNDKNNGRTRRLDFVWNALKQKGLDTGPKIAELTGCTQQNIDYYRYTDDMKVSTMCRMFDSAGLSITFLFKGLKRQQRGHIQVINNSSSITYPNKRQWKAIDGRLSCLVDAVDSFGLPISQLCRLHGISHWVLVRALQRDDIALSELEHIADCLNITLVVVINDN